MAGALAQGTLDGWVKKQKTEPVADVSTEQTQAHCDTEADTEPLADVSTEQAQGHCRTEADSEGTPPPTPMATDEPTQGSGSSVDTAAVAPSLKGAVFAVVGASDSPEVQLLLGAGVTVLDEYSAMMCTHLLCEDTESSEAHRALADGVAVVDRLWVQEACRGGSGEGAAVAATPASSAEAPAEYRIPAEYCLPDDYVDAWDREHVSAAPIPPRHTTHSPPHRTARSPPRRCTPPLPPPPPPLACAPPLRPLARSPRVACVAGAAAVLAALHGGGGHARARAKG